MITSVTKRSRSVVFCPNMLLASCDLGCSSTWWWVTQLTNPVPGVWLDNDALSVDLGCSEVWIEYCHNALVVSWCISDISCCSTHIPRKTKSARLLRKQTWHCCRWTTGSSMLGGASYSRCWMPQPLHPLISLAQATVCTARAQALKRQKALAAATASRQHSGFGRRPSHLCSHSWICPLSQTGEPTLGGIPYLF